LRLLEGDASIIRAVREGTLGTVKQPDHLPNFVQVEAR
jgi:hypothetical protein